MTNQQADAVSLRAIADRLRARGEQGCAELAGFLAELVEDGADLPHDLVSETVTAIRADRAERDA